MLGLTMTAIFVTEKPTLSRLLTDGQTSKSMERIKWVKLTRSQCLLDDYFEDIN